MADVSLRHITKVYDKTVAPAVSDFNLEIADKEFIVLVGPSGCGKSTTLRMIAGLESITGGELSIGGRLVNQVPPKDRDIAMVFQNYALYPHMTVYDNMAFALKLRRVPRSEIDKRVRAAAQTLGIEGLLGRKPRALSGGQRQRVAIGRAIVREPQVFLMDEPLSNLDAKLRNQMRAELIQMRQRIDTTFVYVTHDQTEAMTLADRMVIMKDGLIQQIGTPQEVYNHPSNLFVASFIGSPQMNFFHARLIARAGEMFAEVAGVYLPLGTIAHRLAPEASGQVVLGIRPEHVRIVSPGTQGSIRAELNVHELMGSEVHLHLTVGEDRAVVRASVDVLNETDLSKPAQAIHFIPDARHLHIFDEESGQSLLTQQA